MPKKILALTPNDCKGKSWEIPSDLSHVQHQHLIPIHAGEIGRAAASMPLALVHTDRQWKLVAVCGLQAQENLFIYEGKWVASYQPAWLSTYPLDVVAVADKKIVVFDEASGLLRADTLGAAFYDEAGALNAQLAQKVELLQASVAQHAISQQAIAAMVQADILRPWPQALLDSTGIQIEGLHMVDEKKLAALDNDTFIQLRRAKALPIAYGLNFSVWQAHLLTRAARLQGKVDIDTDALTTDGELDLEFLNDGGTIQFGKLH